MKKYGVSDSYDEGYHAFQIRQSLQDCPYGQGTQEWKNWRDGWYDALDKQRVEGPPERGE